MLPMFMAVADQTIVATALPAIAPRPRRRRAGVMGGGVLSDRQHHRRSGLRAACGNSFGRRRMMFVALVVFMAGSVFCAAGADHRTG